MTWHALRGTKAAESPAAVRARQAHPHPDGPSPICRIARFAVGSVRTSYIQFSPT
jgi:hypothetical protein